MRLEPLQPNLQAPPLASRARDEDQLELGMRTLQPMGRWHVRNAPSGSLALHCTAVRRPWAVQSACLGFGCRSTCERPT